MANVYSGSDPKNKLRVREVDGTPNVFPVSTIVVSNDTLTNDGGGQVTINTGGGSGSGSIGGSIAVNQVAVGSGTDTISGSSGLTFTDSAGVQTFMVSGDEPRIQAQDTTSPVGGRATITLDPSVPDGTGGVAMFWGTDADLELYMKLGAFDGANNVETKNRDLRFFGAGGNLITMDQSALNTAVGGIFGLANSSDPLPLPTRTLDVGETDASTNTVLPLLGLTRTSSGTPAAGIGVGMEFVVETSNNNNEIGASIDAVATEVGSGVENFDLVFNTMATGSAADEKMRVRSTGSVSVAGSLRIGNTGAPSAPLQVNSTAARVGFIVSSVSGSYLEFFDLNTSGLNYVNIGATGDALTFKSNNVQFRMPTSDGATPGEYLITDAAGALSFSPFPTAQPTPDPGLGVAGVTAALQAAGIFI